MADDRKKKNESMENTDMGQKGGQTGTGIEDSGKEDANAVTSEEDITNDEE